MTVSAKHNRMLEKVPGALAKVLGVDPRDIHTLPAQDQSHDVKITASGMTFLIGFKMLAGAAPIDAAIRIMRDSSGPARSKTVPVIAVPYMGELGRRLCEEAGMGWFDLSGNARIIAPGLRVIIDGNPNAFRVVGRRENLFAPMSSRVTRWLLMNPETPCTQRQIAHNVHLSEGFVSRIVARLIAEGYVERIGADGEGNESTRGFGGGSGSGAGAVDGTGDGRVTRSVIRVLNPSLLLESWRAAADFSQNEIIKGHISARSGDELLRHVSYILSNEGVAHATTGLSAAWVLTKFAGFRLATMYLPVDPSPKLLERLGFRSQARGANVWLVVPKDEGVFHGTVIKNEITCVHPVQAYLDLKAQPERATEAADRLREIIPGRRDDA